MSRLLEPLRQIVRDLIEKKLWPIAAVLLVALVAAPMLIGGPGGDAPAPGALAAAEPGSAAAAAAPVADTTAATKQPARAKSKRSGKFDNPFFDPPTPKAEGAGATAGATGGDAGSTRAEAKSPTGEAAPRPGTSSAPATTPTPDADPTTPVDAKKPATTATPAPTATPAAPAATRPPSGPSTALRYLRTAVRVNGNGGAWPRPMARLTPVGGARNPAALFLGVTTAGARYAVFALAANATSHGDATCKRATNCRLIGLKAGQTQVVTVPRSDGGVRRLRLQVRSIRAVWGSAARARAARAHVHDDGRRALFALRRRPVTAAALRTARYDERSGLLRAAAAGALQDSSK